MENSPFAAAYLKELEAEYAASRKCIERIPANLFDFKPHPKSMSLEYLTLLVAEIPKWLTSIIEDGEVNFATYKHVKPTTTEAMVKHFEENFAGAKRALQNVSDKALEEPFYLKNGEQVLSKDAKFNSISSTINHWVHHRGQLTVYMRLNDIAVPSIYGPSADDHSF
jgi:uncharacterized damage-inducible protein DinB